MSKKFEIKNVNVAEFSLEKVKSILWQLYSSPEDVYKRLRIEEKVGTIDTQVIVDAIFAAYNKPLLFGQEEPFVANYGIDLGIKSNVVRDVVLERCHKAVNDEQHCIEKAIKLLKTEDDGEETSYRRLIGGLKEIGFNNREANYLVDSCHLYPVALLLEKLLEVIPKEKKVVPKTRKVTVISDHTTVAEQPVMNQTFISKLVDNASSVNAFYSYVDRYQSEKEVMEKYVSLKNQLEELEPLVALSKNLAQVGLGFETLVSNKEKINDVLTALQALEKVV